MAYQQNQYNDNLTQLAHVSFPANHIITIAMIQRTPMANKRDLKDKFFFFFSLAPGVGNQQNRTYDFKNGKISIKFASRELAGMAETLHQCAIGNDLNVLPFSKFARSAGGTKNVSIWVTSKQQQISGKNVNIKMINMTVSHNKVKHNISLSIADAFGMSKTLNMLAERAITLELKGFQQAPIQNNYQQSQQQQNPMQNSPPQQNFAPNVTAGNQIQNNMGQQQPNFAPQNPFNNG